VGEPDQYFIQLMGLSHVIIKEIDLRYTSSSSGHFAFISKGTFELETVRISNQTYSQSFVYVEPFEEVNITINNITFNNSFISNGIGALVNYGGTEHV
jgi:hypothetical protein